MKFKFPENFLWGAASSACQIEASCDAGGKMPTVADYYARKAGIPSADDGADFYHHFEEDIALMKKLGLKTFRFSISWARIFSDVDSEVNQEGVDYYNRVIDCLVDAGIVPFFDLFHCDMPMFVIDKGGMKNREFIKWFARYAKTCFELFGDRVKLWSTVNEPCINVFGAYATAHTGPFETDLSGGLLASHIMLLAHFEAVRIYKEMGLDGKIGAVNYVQPAYPKTPDEKDVEATSRYRAYHSGIWLDPMMLGEYPKIIMDEPYIAEKMPENYAQELKDAFVKMDFLGINYYGPFSVEYVEDGKLNYNAYKNPELPQDYYGFVFYPQGLFDTMLDLKDRYGDTEIYITENGTAREDTGDAEENLKDDFRIKYMQEHIREVWRSIKAGANIKGYYPWTILDTCECYGLNVTYKHLFGIIQVDMKTKERTPRKSYYYYQDIIKKNEIV